MRKNIKSCEMQGRSKDHFLTFLTSLNWLVYDSDAILSSVTFRAVSASIVWFQTDYDTTEIKVYTVF